MQKVTYQKNKTKNNEKKKIFEEKRAEAFRHFMSAHFEEIYCGEYHNELLTKSIVN